MTRGWAGSDGHSGFSIPFSLLYVENQRAAEVEKSKVLSRVLLGMARESGGAFWRPPARTRPARARRLAHASRRPRGTA